MVAPIGCGTAACGPTRSVHSPPPAPSAAPPAASASASGSPVRPEIADAEPAPPSTDEHAPEPEHDPGAAKSASSHWHLSSFEPARAAHRPRSAPGRVANDAQRFELVL